MIDVMTNGINVSPIIDDMDELRENQIGISFCYYPGYTDIEKSNFCIKNDCGIGLNTRLTMNQTMVDPSGNQDGENSFFNCGNYQLPCFQLKDYKLYICPFAAYINNYCKKFNISIPEDKDDYLDIRTITLDDLHNFCFQPKHMCNYCIQNADSWPWHKSNKTINEYSIPYSEMYFKDYEQYETIINSYKKYFLDCLNEELNPARHEFRYGYELIEQSFYRFGHGKIDLIIPYYIIDYNQVIKLYNTLLSQSIIRECVVYLISDNSPYEKQVMEIFDQAPFTCVYLKTDRRRGPGGARNKGIENSYNKYFICWDSDDYFNSNDTLELLYNDIKSNNYDFITYRLVSDENDNENKQGYVCKRDFIEYNNIRYLELYQGEDYIFSLTCGCLADANKTSNTYSENNDLCIYGLNDNNTNIRSMLSDDLLPYQICSLVIAFSVLSQLAEKGMNNAKQQTISNFERIFNYYMNNNQTDINLLLLFYYGLYLCYKIDSNIIETNITKESKLYTFIQQYKNNNISIIYYSNTINNIDELKDICKQNLQIYKNNTMFIPTYQMFFDIAENNNEKL